MSRNRDYPRMDAPETSMIVQITQPLRPVVGLTVAEIEEHITASLAAGEPLPDGEPVTDPAGNELERGADTELS